MNTSASHPLSGEIAAQRDYYAQTAERYDELQIGPADEHALALGWMAAIIAQRGYKSVLDVGSGTGRAPLFLRGNTAARVIGVEPSTHLRAVGYKKGLSAEELIEGNALALPFADDSFDLVCAFGVLHHIKDHARAVSEMTRVARHAVFISDANNFGQGSLKNCILKQALKVFGLWRLFDLVRTGFKGYHYSEGDGIFYSYSIFGDMPTVKAKFPLLHYMSTRPGGVNLYRSAQTIAAFATRKAAPTPSQERS